MYRTPLDNDPAVPNRKDLEETLKKYELGKNGYVTLDKTINDLDLITLGYGEYLHYQDIEKNWSWLGPKTLNNFELFKALGYNLHNMC